MPSKETLCTRCTHRNICRFTDIYLDIVRAVDSLEINYPTIKSECEVVKVPDIAWLRPIEPMCIYFKKTESTIKESVI